MRITATLASGPDTQTAGLETQLAAQCHTLMRMKNTGWWLTYPSEKYESVGMIIPNIWTKLRIFQTTNQYMLCVSKYTW